MPPPEKIEDREPCTIPTKDLPYRGGIFAGVVCEFSEPSYKKKKKKAKYALAMLIVDFVGVVRGSKRLRMRPNLGPDLGQNSLDSRDPRRES